MPAVPRELPAPVRHFVGREDELAALTRLLGPAGDQVPETVIISAVGGTAGVGKTALAVHWAHQVAGRFPDGQLYVNLRGYDPGQPMTAADRLAGFLLALGVHGQDIPAEAGERAARYRTLLAGRRMLIVLDNAREVEQVRPLLPGTPACAVVVTSRDSLAGLVARDGAQRLELDLLPLAEAVGLLRALIGARVDADPGAAVALAARCCRLPLALRVAAELAAARPAAPLAGLAGELADQHRRLDLLDAGGDAGTEVRAVLSWSYRHLDADAARAFRLLSLYPGADFGRHAAAAVTGTTAERACQTLDRLARACLVQPAGPGRYGMHDLLHAYAAEQAGTHGSADERRAALTRLFDHYLHTSAAAMDTVPRDRRPGRRGPSAGHPGALDLRQGRYRQAATRYGQALALCRETGDLASEAEALNGLGEVLLATGQPGRARTEHATALDLASQTGDKYEQARAHNGLARACHATGDPGQARRHWQEALTLYTDLGAPEADQVRTQLTTADNDDHREP